MPKIRQRVGYKYYTYEKDFYMPLCPRGNNYPLGS